MSCRRRSCGDIVSRGMAWISSNGSDSPTAASSLDRCSSMKLRGPAFTQLMYDLLTPSTCAICVRFMPRSQSKLTTSREMRDETECLVMTASLAEILHAQILGHCNSRQLDLRVELVDI